MQLRSEIYCPKVFTDNAFKAARNWDEFEKIKQEDRHKYYKKRAEKGWKTRHGKSNNI